MGVFSTQYTRKKRAFQSPVHLDGKIISLYKNQKGERNPVQFTSKEGVFPCTLHQDEEIIFHHSTPGRRDYFPTRYNRKKRLFPSTIHQEEELISRAQYTRKKRLFSSTVQYNRKEYFPAQFSRKEGALPCTVYSAPGKKDYLLAQYTRNPLQNTGRKWRIFFSLQCTVFEEAQ